MRPFRKQPSSTAGSKRGYVMRSTRLLDQTAQRARLKRATAASSSETVYTLFPSRLTASPNVPARARPSAQGPDPSSLTQPAAPAGSLIAPVVLLRLKRTTALAVVRETFIPSALAADPFAPASQC